MEELFWVLCLAAGILLLAASFTCYVRRSFTDNIFLSWVVFSAVLIVAGGAMGITGATGGVFLMAAAFVGLLIICMLFRISVIVSELVMKNQELAMHVSLLNQENERILYELKIRGCGEKDSVCDQYDGESRCGDGAAVAVEEFAASK